MTEENPEIKKEEEVPNEVKTQNENTKTLNEDFYYPDNEIEGKYSDAAPISSKHSRFYHNFGMNTYKNKNLHCLHSSLVISANGNYFQMLNISNMKLKFQEGKDGDGIGSICVSHDKM